jgi:hypothetical protein
MNITIRHKIYYLYLNSIREFSSRIKNYMYLYSQYRFDPIRFHPYPSRSIFEYIKLPVIFIDNGKLCSIEY